MVTASNAKVKLYLTDYGEKLDSIALYEGITDTNGVFLVKDLAKKIYYALVISRCLSNYGINYINLTEAKNNTTNIDVWLEEQSSIKISNLTNDDYILYTYGIGDRYLHKGLSYEF